MSYKFPNRIIMWDLTNPQQNSSLLYSSLHTSLKNDVIIIYKSIFFFSPFMLFKLTDKKFILTSIWVVFAAMRYRFIRKTFYSLLLHMAWKITHDLGVIYGSMSRKLSFLPALHWLIIYFKVPSVTSLIFLTFSQGYWNHFSRLPGTLVML